MRLALASVYSHDRCTLKDVAGGYGTVFEVGRSLPARLLERAKVRLAHLPPVALGTLAARLRALGHEVRPVEVRNAADAAEPLARAHDAVVVLASLVDAPAERALMRALRRLGCRVIAFGAAASALTSEFATDADVVLVGEPEGSPDALWVEVLSGERTGVVHTGEVEDLDGLPFPDWRGFPVARYRYALLDGGGPTLPIQGARGCPFGCGYCPWRTTARFRQREPARIAEEARRARDLYGVRALAFREPLFNFDIERTHRIARLLAPLGLEWSAEMRADRLDDDLIEVCARAGLRSLEIGVESIDRALLAREHRKPPTHAQIERVVRSAQARGVRVICNFVLGLPGDDERTMRETIRWARELDSFAVQFTVATPYPGTSLERRHRLPVLDEPASLTGFRPHALDGAVSPSRLEALREWAYVSYHFRPRYAATFLRHFVRAFQPARGSSSKASAQPAH